MEDALEKEFEEGARGRDDDACKLAAASSRANMLLPFIHCTPAAASRILYCNPVCFLSTMVPPSSSSAAAVGGGGGGGAAAAAAGGGGRRAAAAASSFFNVMAISWLAPANSHGGFVFCIKKSRASFAAMLPAASFGLSVATAHQTEMLLQVGAISAKAGPKHERMQIPRCCFANASAAAASAVAAASSGNKRSRNSFAALAQESDAEDGDHQQQQQQQQQQSAAYAKFFISSSCAHITAEVVRVTDAADAGHALVVAQVQKPNRTPVLS